MPSLFDPYAQYREEEDQVFITYDQLLQQMEPFDWLLVRGNSIYSKLIKVSGRTPYSHVGALDTVHGVPVFVDIVEGRGGGSETLERTIQSNNGRCDFFKVNPGNLYPGFDREKAITKMWEFEGIEYGWKALRMASLRHLFVVRLFVRNYVDDYTNGEQPKLPPYCSMGINSACIVGGIDPVPRLSVGLTEPGDLGRTMFVSRVGSVII